MEILERNEQALECLEKKFILKYQSLKDCDFEHCFVTETINHQKIICQERDGYNWRLNSIYAERCVNFVRCVMAHRR